MKQTLINLFLLSILFSLLKQNRSHWYWLYCYLIHSTTLHNSPHSLLSTIHLLFSSYILLCPISIHWIDFSLYFLIPFFCLLILTSLFLFLWKILNICCLLIQFYLFYFSLKAIEMVYEFIHLRNLHHNNLLVQY